MHLALLLTSSIFLGQTHFRDEVRPLLVEHCLGCHGPDKSKGGLDLSSRDSILEGGAHGPALVPGKANESLLFNKVRRGLMPPKKPLAPEQIAVLKRWIDAGAAWDGPPLADKKIAATPRPWSFEPLARPAIPDTKYDALARNPIDRFLFQKMQDKGLTPSTPAERLALLRRVTFDLTGLLPTPAEVDAFLSDDAADAYAKVVDRLLASPAHGERWARHWLDVVRWGESNGYEQNHIRPKAWPYRDYVVHAFNTDKPYDDFVTEQLAGDAVGNGDPNIEVATGFLVAGVNDTVGNATEEGRRQQRINDLEDIVSTVGAAFLGMTVGCARCHDHKFDPIAQRDFYRLAAVFAGVRHGERLVGRKAPLEDKERRLELFERARAVRNLIHDLELVVRARILRSQGVDPPRAAIITRHNIDDFPATLAKFVRLTILATKDNAEPCIDELEIFGPAGRENLARGGKASASSLLPGHELHKVEHLNDGRSGNDWSWISRERGKGWAQIELPDATPVSRVVWGRDSMDQPRYYDRLASRYRIDVSLDGTTWRAVSSHEGRAVVAEQFLDDEFHKAMTADETQQHRLLYEELYLLRGMLATSHQASFYVGQFSTPDTVYLLKRGDVMQRGDVVAPGAIAALPGALDDKLMDTEPGRRLALAGWITDPKNPLTARVLVNRLWQHHFGRGLVATASDFGNNGVRPSHPELLDWLAVDFMEHGWKLKRLHRLMVTSYAYQQSSEITEKNQTLDADNQYVWRMPLRRLEAEGLRDAMLAVSGKLERRLGGPSFPLFKYRVVNVAIYEPLETFGPETWRRTLYALSARGNREELLANFDCPECAQRTPRRETTTTPLQALSLLNGAFTQQQAGFFAERVAGRMDDAFRLALGRPPSAEERRAATALVERHGWLALCRALLNANEFLYY